MTSPLTEVHRDRLAMSLARLVYDAWRLRAQKESAGGCHRTADEVARFSPDHSAESVSNRTAPGRSAQANGSDGGPCR